MAAITCCIEPVLICLVTNASSDRCGTCVCCLWRRIHRCSNYLALDSRRYTTQHVGYHWYTTLIGWDVGYHVSTPFLLKQRTHNPPYRAIRLQTFTIEDEASSTPTQHQCHLVIPTCLSHCRNAASGRKRPLNEYWQRLQYQ